MATNLLKETHWFILTMAIIISTNPSMGATDNLTITNSKPGCQRQCGDLIIPYPFGIGSNCSLSSFYSIVCDNSYYPPRAFIENLDSSLTRYQVFSISDSQIRVSGMIAYNCPNEIYNLKESSKSVKFLPHFNSSLTLSIKENFLSLAGSCDYFANFSITGQLSENLTCPLSCFGKFELKFKSEVCSANNGCCKRPIRNNLRRGFSLSVVYNKRVPVTSHTACAYVVVGMEDSLVLRYSDYSDPASVIEETENMQMVADWEVGSWPCDSLNVITPIICVSRIQTALMVTMEDTVANVSKGIKEILISLLGVSI